MPKQTNKSEMMIYLRLEGSIKERAREGGGEEERERKICDLIYWKGELPLKGAPYYSYYVVCDGMLRFCCWLAAFISLPPGKFPF